MLLSTSFEVIVALILPDIEFVYPSHWAFGKIENLFATVAN